MRLLGGFSNFRQSSFAFVTHFNFLLDTIGPKCEAAAYFRSNASYATYALIDLANILQ